MKFQLPIKDGQLSIVYEKKSENAPTIIFLHDALGCSKTWHDFPELLSQKTQCNYLIYDRLGHGDSSSNPHMLQRKNVYLHKEADVLIDIIKELKLSKPILFGHSDGASIALITASKLNDTLGIIVEAPHIFVEEITLEGIRKVKEIYKHKAFKQKLKKYHGTKTDDVFNAWAETWLNHEFRSWNIESLLSQITCPTLVIQGEDDEFGSLKQVEGIVDHVRGEVKKEIIKNVGHNPHKESQDKILNLSTNFIGHRKS